jgi:hypothetical protein
VFSGQGPGVIQATSEGLGGRTQDTDERCILRNLATPWLDFRGGGWVEAKEKMKYCDLFAPSMMLTAQIDPSLSVPFLFWPT